ncbi:glycosyltransferase [Sporolactobacillus terrae]|uniref:glycosyltransferase n=1 Tax=Sporolactobacillus terrae TaxID=269673 RepID=UPI000686C845|nr:glycosyltransferase [Sporolactobacillus terrae]
MKKIVFVIWHVSGRGGTETVLKTVTHMLTGSEFKPQIFILGDTEDTTWLKGITYDACPYIKNKYIRIIPYLISLFKYLHKEKPDIVVGLSPMICQLLYSLRAILKKKYPIISWIHFSLNANNMNKNLLKNADYHLAISSGIKKQYKELGIDEDSIFMVYNPVINVDQMVERPKNKAIFVYMGRVLFEEQKRLKDLFDALSNISGEWLLYIIGDGKDYNKCQTYSLEKGIDSHVKWFGWQDDPWSVVNEATALVLTSEYEGFPMVLTEAIARGIYCVSSDCPTGPNDIIIKKVNGELFDTGNLNALTEVLQNVIDTQNLPDQMTIKNSINKYYIKNYNQNLYNAFSCVISKWDNRG